MVAGVTARKYQSASFTGYNRVIWMPEWGSHSRQGHTAADLVGRPILEDGGHPGQSVGATLRCMVGI